MIDPGMRDEGPELTDRLLRQFAALWIVFIGGFAIFYGIGRARVVPGVVLGLLAVIPGLWGLVRPRSMELLFRIAMAIATPIGWVVSLVLLAAIFYVVMTPLALVFKMIGRDALARGTARAASQWVPRETTSDVRRYWYQS
jgi:hypothetical protein